MVKKLSGTVFLAFALISGLFSVSANAQSLFNGIQQQEQTDKKDGDKMEGDKMKGDKMEGDKMAGKKKKKKKHGKSGDKMKKT